MNFKRQGDLLFIQIPKAEKASPAPKGRILAEGEATGHSHAVLEADLGNCDVFLDATGRLVVQVRDGETVTVAHQEHGPIELEAGFWEVRRQREYEPDGWHEVRD